MDACLPNGAAPDFLPALQAWFSERYGAPTDIQASAWGHIAAGEHLLITAPTGSGKTLAAFLWSLNQLAGQRWPLEVTSVLYVSPLKALNNDIQRNLLTPLAELAAAFAARGESFPEIRVQTRSGDTSQTERQRMLRRPPEILITTPESLNLLLATARGQAMLRHLQTVILDEVHAVAGTKRGVHLMTAVERLVELSGEFQRLSLSATVRPAEAVAHFVGGQRRLGPDQYAPRPVRVLTSSLRKEVSLRVYLPPAQPDHTAVVDRVTPLLREVIDRNRSTLVFVNSRRLSESLTATLNADVDEPRAYAHHGSLSREVRLAVEERLKAGRLRSIVATSSLELGIDVGALDETVLVQAPPSVAAAVQRIGRAGHQVGQVSRGTLVAIHPHDLLELAAVTQAVLAGEIEPTTPIEAPLDVLAQVIVGAVAAQERSADELFDLVRTSFPYRDLKRPQFDLVVQMLCGRYAGTRLRELQPRLSVDPATGGLRANPAGLQALRAGGGTIPDRGYFQLRHLETRARLGELDEEFVWENGPGSRFTFGNRQWRVEKVTHSDVLALPAGGKANIPFWRAEEPSRTFHLAERVGLLLQTCEEQRDDPELVTRLQRGACLEEPAARELLTYLDDQRAATGCPLPHRHHLLVEYLESGPQEAPGNQIYLHAVWGRDVTRPFALALGAAWAERYGHAPEIHANNDGVSLILSQELPVDDLLSLVSAADAERLLRRSLETSSFFGARFRECAGRALLLAHGPVGRRTPLWLSRLKAQEVLDAAVGLADFPVLLEAWRTCCQDEFDLDSLRLLLHELEDGRIAVSSVRLPAASPFARRDVWRQVNEYVYAEEPAARGPSSLREDLVRTVALDPRLRPGVAPAIAEELQGKLQRLTPGYGPQTSRELVDWIGERLLVPWEEWLGLIAQLPPEAHHSDEWEPRLVRLEPVLARTPLVCSRANLEALYRGLFADHTVHAATLGGAELEVMPAESPEDPPDPVELLGWWLSFYGPVSAAWIGAVL
ncbi:MAG: DEAD/DEAH box helicase, partial [Candidatus Latescibacterota bacterium]